MGGELVTGAMGTSYQSWSVFPIAQQSGVTLDNYNAPLPIDRASGNNYLPFGNGRSYGDCCLNDGGVLIDCRGLNRIIDFDAETGVLRCEAGVLLADILKLVLPKGWFLPVTPGTQLVTVGGAIANDVHGKNHHVAGTLGRYVRRFELLRSDGSRRICSPQENTTWFEATVGGLGLTGVITWAEIQMKPVANSAIDQEVIRFSGLRDFFDLSRDSENTHEYTVAWIDSLASGAALGRGLFIRGNHAGEDDGPVPEAPGKPINMPFNPPFPLINWFSLKCFNALYYRKQLARRKRSLVHYEPFFYPLDRIRNWYRLYGPKGLLQHQSVIPHEVGEEAVRELLERSMRAGAGSFLTVLKEFGSISSAGMMSFPRPGVTLTLDFSNQGKKVFVLLEDLDAVVREAGGAVNPYKDGRMSAESFQGFFPQWQAFSAYIDPRFSSSLWRRVTQNVAVNQQVFA